jgi:hypothetical protein
MLESITFLLQGGIMRVWTLILMLVFFLSAALLALWVLTAIRTWITSKREAALYGLTNKSPKTDTFLLKLGSIAIIVSFALLLYIGKPQSLLLTMRMSGLRQQAEVKFTGGKAITAVDYNDVFGLFDAILIFEDSMFHYSHDYLPKQMRAQTTSDIGLIVTVSHHRHRVGTYSNGGAAWQHDIAVSFFDGLDTVAEREFQGEPPPSVRGGSGGASGMPVEDEIIEEWIAAQLDDLL